MSRSSPTVADVGERGLLERIERLVDPHPSGYLGFGDDAAVVPAAAGGFLWTTDAMVEGTHFHPAWFRPEEVGFKALAVNLSDAAAMGGAAGPVLISLILPSPTRVDAVLRLYRGMRKLARRQGVAILGGNVARGAAISVTVTLLGSLSRGKAILRSGARPGDRLYVSGWPGLAHLGLRLLAETAPVAAGARRGRGRTGAESLWDPPASRAPGWRVALARTSSWHRRALTRFLVPEPRLRTARELRLYRPTAMIDVSDGLASDLRRLAETGSRLVVDPGRFPGPPGLRRLCDAMGVDFAPAVLAGGEDYELLFTLPASVAAKVGSSAAIGGVPVTEIGEVAPGRPGVFLREGNRLRPMPAEGFRHFDPPG